MLKQQTNTRIPKIESYNLFRNLKKDLRGCLFVTRLQFFLCYCQFLIRFLMMVNIIIAYDIMTKLCDNNYILFV